MSKIEWTDLSWNPVTGCDKISPGCENCYAEKFAHRLQRMSKPKYANGFEVVQHPASLDEPLHIKGRKRIFVNSMSDLFHPEVDYDFINRCVQTMWLTPQHTYQVLTKRPKTAAHWHRYQWHKNRHGVVLPPNLWLGVSIEDREHLWRLQELVSLPAAIRFLSLEPLLEDLEDFNLSGIDWVIVGGESGPGARPMHADWVRRIRDQCAKESVPFFFKQWGGVNKSKTGNTLDGRLHQEFPDDRP